MRLDVQILIATVISALRSAAVVIAAIATVPVAAHGQSSTDVAPYPALEGLRYGISVTDLEGNVLEAHRADERFVPASNVKLFVTAAALAAEAELTSLNSGMQVLLEPQSSGPPNLKLVGRGDPTIGFGPKCKVRCIETLAKTVAEAGITEVGDVIGNDQWFADERMPLGWSWDDLKFGHGTAISAIAVNENIVPLRVSPSSKEGLPVRANWTDNGPSYFSLHNEARTSDEENPWALRVDRRTDTETARLYGELPLGSRAVTLDLGVDDPAHLAAWFFRRALEAEGVTVTGKLQSKHRPLQYSDEPKPIDPNDPASERKCTSHPRLKHDHVIVAELPPSSIRDIVTVINKDSQNLYAEVLLRQLGKAAGTGSTFCGLQQIEDHLDEIGVLRSSYDIGDGSGLSNYNRATPSTITALLRHAAAETWGDAFKDSLPIGGGPDGTLKYRFRGTHLQGRVFAKTGTLNHVDALSGYMKARSGKTLVFSVIVNDRPLDAPRAIAEIDATLLSIAQRH